MPVLSIPAVVPDVAPADRETAGVAADAESEPATAAPEVAAVAPTGRILPVPFRSQMDDSDYRQTNCGPAALGMVLEAFGMPQRTMDLRWRSHGYQGTNNQPWAGTAIEYLAQVGADFGLQPMRMLDSGKPPPPGKLEADWHRWTTDEVRSTVLAGEPVIPLVKFRLLPGHEDRMISDDHYVVIFGVDGDDFLYHDPIYAEAAEGAGVRISAEGLSAAMGAASIPNQAVAFGPGTRAAIAPAPIA
jgi:hypothetical protein